LSTPFENLEIKCDEIVMKNSWERLAMLAGTVMVV
jgi:hypothetical protein